MPDEARSSTTKKKEIAALLGDIRTEIASKYSATWITPETTSTFDVSEPATSTQVGGQHYAEMPVQPAMFCEKNKLSFLASCVVKRMCRWDKPSGKGLQDLQKAKHEIDLLIEIHGVTK